MGTRRPGDARRGPTRANKPARTRACPRTRATRSRSGDIFGARHAPPGTRPDAAPANKGRRREQDGRRARRLTFSAQGQRPARPRSHAPEGTRTTPARTSRPRTRGHGLSGDSDPPPCARSGPAPPRANEPPPRTSANKTPARAGSSQTAPRGARRRRSPPGPRQRPPGEEVLDEIQPAGAAPRSTRRPAVPRIPRRRGRGGGRRPELCRVYVGIALHGPRPPRIGIY